MTGQRINENWRSASKTKHIHQTIMMAIVKHYGMALIFFGISFLCWWWCCCYYYICIFIEFPQFGRIFFIGYCIIYLTFNCHLRKYSLFQWWYHQKKKEEEPSIGLAILYLHIYIFFITCSRIYSTVISTVLSLNVRINNVEWATIMGMSIMTMKSIQWIYCAYLKWFSIFIYRIGVIHISTHKHLQNSSNTVKSIHKPIERISK